MSPEQEKELLNRFEIHLEKQDTIRSDVHEIKVGLLGDNYGNDGLVKEFQEIKKLVEKHDKDIARAKTVTITVGTIVSAIVSTITAFFYTTGGHK